MADNVLRLPDVDGAPKCKGRFIGKAPPGGPSMCPKRLPEPANAGPPAGGTQGIFGAQGRARDPTKWSRRSR